MCSRGMFKLRNMSLKTVFPVMTGAHCEIQETSSVPSNRYRQTANSTRTTRSICSESKKGTVATFSHDFSLYGMSKRNETKRISFLIVSDIQLSLRNIHSLALGSECFLSPISCQRMPSQWHVLVAEEFD